jgi:ABC-type multidrug transport system permease subunit
MDININTPALLFPTVSLILLAYTNRFLAIANLVRNLRKQYDESHNQILLLQIHNLKRRLELIRYMQAFGVTSLLIAIFCMFLLFLGYTTITNYIFGLSLICLMISLTFSLREIIVSINALDLYLSDLDHEIKK